MLPGEVHRSVDPQASADVLLDAWADAALAVLAGTPPARIGIAVLSPFDLAAGVSAMTHKFAALHGVDVQDGLQHRWTGTTLAGVPLAFGNDADLFTLGEWWGGAARGTGRVIGVTLGTGLGSGFVDGGQVVTSGSEVPPDGELWNASYTYKEATKIRGLSRFPEGRVPLAKQVFEFVVEYPCSDLKQEVGPARGPAHRLFLDEPLADHLIDRGLDEARRDSLPGPVPLAVVHHVGLNLAKAEILADPTGAVRGVHKRSFMHLEGHPIEMGLLGLRIAVAECRAIARGLRKQLGPCHR